MPPAFDSIKNFDHDDHTAAAKQCYLGCSRFPDVDGMIGNKTLR